MQEIIDQLTGYWRPIAIGLSVLLYFMWDKIKEKLGNIKLPDFFKQKTVDSVNTVVVVPPKVEPIKNIGRPIPNYNLDDLEEMEGRDIKALAHLRKRAVDVKDVGLLKEIKDASSKFFDIHSGIIDTNVDGSV